MQVKFRRVPSLGHLFDEMKNISRNSVLHVLCERTLKCTLNRERLLFASHSWRFSNIFTHRSDFRLLAQVCRIHRVNVLDLCLRGFTDINGVEVRVFTEAGIVCGSWFDVDLRL